MTSNQNPDLNATNTETSTEQEGQTFKGLSDLVTRDPVAMEHAPQDAAYAGAAPTPTALDNQVLATAAAGLGSGGMLADPLLAQAGNPNPGYTPPSQMAPVHQPESVSDLPGGAPEQARLDSLE